MFLVSFSLHAQNGETEFCGSAESPLEAQIAAAAFDQFHSEKPLLLAKMNEMDTLSFPIRFTVFRLDDGTMPDVFGQRSGAITQNEINQAIFNLNEAYAPIKVKFFQDGPINYIDNSKARLAEVPAYLFSFTSSNSNGYIHWTLGNGVVGKGSRLFSPPSSYNQYGSVGNGLFYIRDSTYLHRPTLVHEMGHVLGLNHTFQGGDILYDNPADPLVNSPMEFKDRNTRELVIRVEQEEGTANFLVPNYETAGDRFEDTPAWGRTNSNWPSPNDSDCSVYVDAEEGVVNCSSGFLQYNCFYFGDYVDYNGHELENLEAGMSNFMSYSDAGTAICRTNFTEDQYLMQNSNASRYGVDIWDPSKGTSYVDTVQFWHTTVPVKNANIALTHTEEGPAEGRYSRVTTPKDGSFSAKQFDSSVKAKSTILGSGNRNSAYVNESDTSYAIYYFTEDDWLDDVTTHDIVLLTRYILGQITLNPFQKLAADVNRDGELNVTDIIGIRRLILGLDVAFDDYPSGPWQFVPEVISQSPDFLSDPFNMTLSGTSYNNEAPYIRSDFFFVPTLGDKAGFDAYKLGDIGGSSVERLSEGNISFDNCSEKGEGKMVAVGATMSLGKNKSFVYQVSPTVVKDIAGFQLEIEFDNTKVELLNKQAASGELVESAAVGTTTAVSHWSNETKESAKTRVRLSYVFDGNNTDYSQKIDPGENMMGLVFKTKATGVDLSTAIALGTNIPLEVYDANGCMIRQDFVAEISQIEEGKIFSGSKEVSDYQPFSMSISPNPVSDRATFIIKSPVDEQYEITFYSMTTGQKIRTLSVTTSGGYLYKKISTEDLPKDVFVVKVKGGETNYSTKLIKL